MRILSLDLGEKSLGLSITDETKTIAIPLENYFFQSFNFIQAIEKVKTTLEQYPTIDLILVGHPIRTDGKKSIATEFCEKFAIDLKNFLKVKTILFNEQFSTQRGLSLINNKKINKLILKKTKMY